MSDEVDHLLDRLARPEQFSGFDDPQFSTEIEVRKASAVAEGDESKAKRLWIVEAVANCQRKFVAAFRELQAQRFYEAWCEIEQLESALAGLSRHYRSPVDDPHRIDFVSRMVGSWQRLFPYKLFLSPEYLKKRTECSVCGAIVTPRSDCGHRVGEIYRGEACYRIVKEVEVLGISLVDEPEQKYSVVFPTDEHGNQQDYNYDVLKFVIERVTSPFHVWSAELTTRTIPRSALSDVLPTQQCPCGSRQVFGACCSQKEEVSVPHMQFTFSVQPPTIFPST